MNARIVSADWSFRLKGALSGVGGQLLLGYAMSFLPQEDPNREIKEALKGIQTDLAEIKGQIEAVHQTLDDLQNQLAQAKAAIQAQIGTDAKFTNKEALIEDLEKRLRGLIDRTVAAREPGRNATEPSKRELGAWTNDVLKQTKVQVLLGQMHDDLCGSAAGTEGALWLITEALVQDYRSARGRPDLMGDPEDQNSPAYYLSLETFFDHVLLLENRAALLVTEAMHYRDEHLRGAGGRGDGTARTPDTVTPEQFLIDHRRNISAQVDRFVECVEYLVAQTADLDPHVGCADFLAPGADRVLHDADYVAAHTLDAWGKPGARLKHPYGVVVRVIGEPIWIPETASADYVPQIIAWGVVPRDISQREFGVPEYVEWDAARDDPVFLDPFEWGKPRLHPANLLRAKVTDKIAVAKYVAEVPNTWGVGQSISAKVMYQEPATAPFERLESNEYPNGVPFVHITYPIRHGSTELLRWLKWYEIPGWSYYSPAAEGMGSWTLETGFWSYARSARAECALGSGCGTTAWTMGFAGMVAIVDLQTHDARDVHFQLEGPVHRFAKGTIGDAEGFDCRWHRAMPFVAYVHDGTEVDPEEPTILWDANDLIEQDGGPLMPGAECPDKGHTPVDKTEPVSLCIPGGKLMRDDSSDSTPLRGLAILVRGRTSFNCLRYAQDGVEFRLESLGAWPDADECPKD